MLIAMAALVVFASAVAAQVTGGAVTGTVLDPDGSAVVGATVTLKDKSRGLDFTTQTTGAGSYQFTNVPTGTYTMTVTAKGFTESTGQVLVSLNQTVTADVALTITAGTAVVNVVSGIEMSSRRIPLKLQRHFSRGNSWSCLSVKIRTTSPCSLRM